MAPVVYEGVKDPPDFEAAEGPPVSPPRRRVVGKRPVEARVSVDTGGESESELQKGFGVVDDHDAEQSNSECLELQVPRGKGESESSEGERNPSVFNMWSEEARCYICEASVQMSGATPRCSSCGLEAQRKLSVEESETRAEAFLKSDQPIDREKLDDLLASSLCSWNPKTRKQDRSLQGTGAMGWTLGFYRYGPKIGITKETLRRPLLTRLINRFMQQEGGPGNWASVRVTSGFASEMHRDNNEKDLLVPVSRFREGRLWIEGPPLKGEMSQVREIPGERVDGRLVGGDSEVVWFDASLRHSVEKAEGSRRVLVGYTPRSLDALSSDLQHHLLTLGFPLPCLSGIGPSPSPQPFSTDVDGSLQAEARDGGSEEPRFCEGALTEPELEQLQHEHFVLRRVLIEQQKNLHEEIGIAACEGWDHGTSHLCDLHCWINDTEECLLHHVSKQQLSNPHVTSDERCVLEARLRSLGVSSESEEAQTWTGLYADHDPDVPGSGGVGRKDEKALDPETQAWQAEPAQVLQTVAVSHAEVLKHVEEWRGPACEELGSIFDIHRTLRKISSEDVTAFKEASDVIEYLPAKALFQIKAGAGRKKVRVVACGNFAEDAGSKSKEKRFQNYAGGADTLSLRCHMKFAGARATTHGWVTSGGDIRTAFLLAPLVQPGHRKILRPPHTLVKAGIVDPNELWLVTGAIYGLQESPAAWATHRHSVIPTIEIRLKGQSMYLQRSQADANMWMLRCPQTQELLALLSVYVDDLLLSADTEVSAAVWEAIQSTWKISTPVYATAKDGLKFCGFELHQDDTGLRVSQQSYIRSLLDKYPNIQGEVSVPYAKECENQELKPTASIERIRYAQALVGEILWVATRSRPDLSFAVSRIGQLITKDTEQAIQRAEDTVRYLRHSIHYELRYGSPGDGRGPGDLLPVDRGDNLIEVFADASFCPGTDKSQTGLVILWGNSPIAWLSLRQPCASLSTAEAELQASLDGMTLAYGLLPLLKELSGEDQKALLYNDNQGACTVMNMPQGTWRTRHLRLKAAWFFEQLEHAKFRVYHVPGQFMLGDLCTKPLQGVRVRDLLHMMQMRIEPSGPDGGESDDKRKALISPVSGPSTGTGGVVPGGAVKALRMLSVASLLREATSKLVKVQVELDDYSEYTSVVETLKLVACLVAVFGALALLAWSCKRDREEEAAPRIRAMRGVDEDTMSEWSVIDTRSELRAEPGFGETIGVEAGGLRHRRSGERNSGCGSRSLAVPASQIPKGPENPVAVPGPWLPQPLMTLRVP